MAGGVDDDDPRPLPPERPDNDECCHSGCNPCVFDLYQEELEQYRARLKEWEARHMQPTRKTSAKVKGSSRRKT
jgi:hypothetical protein